MGGRNCRIRDIPEVDRPREKMINKGPDALKDKELIAILLGSGVRGENAIKVAEQILRKYGEDLSKLAVVSINELMEGKGIGKAKGCRLLAALELGRRIWKKCEEDIFIRSPEDAYNCSRDLSRMKKEYFRVFYLNGKSKVIKDEIISIGSLSASLVHPREVFNPAVGAPAASIILVHNHPSGDPEPSTEDLALTRRLAEAGRIMGIEILDHIIVGDRKYVSLKERGFL